MADEKKIDVNSPAYKRMTSPGNYYVGGKLLWEGEKEEDAEIDSSIGEQQSTSPAQDGKGMRHRKGPLKVSIHRHSK